MNKEENITIKKKHILNSLKILLEKYSYSYVSMQDVANEGGISKGGLRYYFPTKESLFIGLLEDFFQEIEDDHIRMISMQDGSGDKAVLSTLFNIENFVLNQKNIKIFINLILYGLENPKMMEPISSFFRKHLQMYKKIINQAKTDLPVIDKKEFDTDFLARITQIIFLSAGLLETIDPIGMDPARLARYVLSLFSE
ncbi:MAG TPA: TetR/AcrR family transcriptional regulator [Spirochaetota bacterium]|nr:TetR/AcrR family transcriptional regulator [Spirochaetota bacterium]HPS86534.1 TetR/AcrR family transcriptional regulator [Spirochaetota bacterium]